jgi:hypothetical protein
MVAGGPADACCGLMDTNSKPAFNVWRIAPLLSFLLMVVAGWVHRHRLTVIEFLQAENRLPKAKLGDKRIRVTDAERALLARRRRQWAAKRFCSWTRSSRPTLVRRHYAAPFGHHGIDQRRVRCFGKP